MEPKQELLWERLARVTLRRHLTEAVWGIKLQNQDIQDLELLQLEVLAGSHKAWDR
jgi:hypothetical protein